MASNQMWDENIDDTLPEKVFDINAVEMPLNMFILDLPNMQKFENKHADRILEVLSETSNTELFTSAAMRAVVELKWPLVRKAMIKNLLIPYLVLLSSFIYYTTFLFENIQE